MKLLELIVKNVKRENIHPGVSFFAQNWKDKENKILYFIDKPHAGLSFWEGGWYLEKDSLKVGVKADDAAETVPTREELMRAYDLVKHGYTLWFGGDCPVAEGTLVDVCLKNGKFYQDVSDFYRWSNSKSGHKNDIIAYRIIQTVDKAPDSVPSPAPLVEADAIVADAIEKRIKTLGSDEWEEGYDKICVSPESGYKASKGSDLVIITRAQWDDYISRKIRVGDKAMTPGEAEVQVIFVTDKSALVRYVEGDEMLLPLHALTRLPQ